MSCEAEDHGAAKMLKVWAVECRKEPVGEKCYDLTHDTSWVTKDKIIKGLQQTTVPEMLRTLYETDFVHRDATLVIQPEYYAGRRIFTVVSGHLYQTHDKTKDLARSFNIVICVDLLEAKGWRFVGVAEYQWKPDEPTPPIIRSAEEDPGLVKPLDGLRKWFQQRDPGQLEQYLDPEFRSLMFVEGMEPRTETWEECKARVNGEFAKMPDADIDEEVGETQCWACGNVGAVLYNPRVMINGKQISEGETVMTLRKKDNKWWVTGSYEPIKIWFEDVKESL